MDDVIVRASTKTLHDKRLRSLFECSIAHNMILNPNQCATTQFTCLGFVISVFGFWPTNAIPSYELTTFYKGKKESTVILFCLVFVTDDLGSQASTSWVTDVVKRYLRPEMKQCFLDCRSIKAEMLPELEVCVDNVLTSIVNLHILQLQLFKSRSLRSNSLQLELVEPMYRLN